MNHQYYKKEYYQQDPYEHAEERFRKRYELHIEPSKRHYRHRSVPISYQHWIKDGSINPFHQEVEREPLLKVYISKDRYEFLVKREHTVEELEQENYRLKRVEDSFYKEMAVRNSNDTVKKAWEKYQMLLELSR